MVDKPHGTLSVPSRLGENDERLCVGTSLQKELKKQIWPVHRLDFEVSGLLMFAKNSKAHSVASSWFEHADVQKTYLAYTEGVAEESWQEGETSFLWDSLLVRGKKRSFEAPYGKPAITRALYAGRAPGFSTFFLKWLVFPKTGRSHQIRFEMSKHGFPILGDSLYGSKDSFLPGPSMALRSIGLNFENCKGREGFASLPEKIALPENFSEVQLA